MEKFVLTFGKLAVTDYEETRFGNEDPTIYSLDQKIFNTLDEATEYAKKIFMDVSNDYLNELTEDAKDDEDLAARMENIVFKWELKSECEEIVSSLKAANGHLMDYTSDYWYDLRDDFNKSYPRLWFMIGIG